MKTCGYCGKEYPDEATVCERDAQPLVDPAAPNPPPPPSSNERPKPTGLLNPWVVGLVCGVVGALLFSPANWGIHLGNGVDYYEFDKNGNPKASFNLVERLPLFAVCGVIGIVISFIFNQLRKASKK